MKKISIALVFLLSSSVYLVGQNCNSLPKQFDSYLQAIKLIKVSEFKTIDNLPYGKSSWIASATYYTCDGITGYLIYTTDKGKEYIHEKVPNQVWIDFKNASSSGSYYIKNIQGKYELLLSR